MPAAVGRMPVAWHQLKIPSAPPGLALSPAERAATTPGERFRRRTIQRLEVRPRPNSPSHRPGSPIESKTAGADPERTEQLALIDKVSPHALYDLMLTEVSPPEAGRAPKADAGSVDPITGRILWQSAANFHRFTTMPEIRRAFELDNGWLQLALNCDPTTDRESVQALKSFHLHLIYWRAPELRPLRQAERFADQRDPYLSRQCLDPISFLTPLLLEDCLADLDLEPSGASWLPADAEASCTGCRPLGSLLLLPSWDGLATPAFERLIRALHQRLLETAERLLYAFTGMTRAPAPWHRHRLLPMRQIAANLEPLGLRAEVREALLELAQRLRNLSPPLGAFLRRRSATQRMHCMTLRQPCYSLSLSAMDARGRATTGAQGPLILSIQPKLFSGIGGAGLVSLPGLPSVRVLRAHGQYSESDWMRRAAFQQRFAAYNTQSLIASPQGRGGELLCGPIHHFRGAASGWSSA
jgi:hypothetical protein